MHGRAISEGRTSVTDTARGRLGGYDYGRDLLHAFLQFGWRGELPVLSLHLSDEFQPTCGYDQIIPAQFGVGLCRRLPHTIFAMAKAFANSITQHRTPPLDARDRVPSS